MRLDQKDKLEYLKTMRNYLESIRSITPEKANNTLIKTGVIDKNGNLIDHYKDHDPYLTTESKKRK